MHTLNSGWTRVSLYLGVALAVVLSWQGTAAAASGTWTNTVDGQWEDTANWSGGVIADGADSTADFNTLDIVDQGSPFFRVGVGLNTNRTIGHLNFGDTNTATPGAWEIYFPVGGTQVLTLAGTTPSITVNPLGPIDTGTPPVIDDAIIRPTLAGTSGLTKLGSGTLAIAGTGNTLTGGINVNAGTLRLQSAIPGQAINIANGATLQTGVTLDATNTPAAGHTINVASGATANINTTATVEMGNFNAAGATLNLNLNTAATTLTADGDWALNGSAAAINVSSTAGGTFRLRPNSGSPNFNTVTAFANTLLSLNNVTMFTRTNSGGNTVNVGALSGTSTALLTGGGQGGGTFANYSIGALNTDTVYAGTIDSTTAPDPDGSLNLTKVGTGKLTLSGTLTYQPTANANAGRRGGIATVAAGTLALTNSAAIPGGIAGNNLATVDVQAGATLDVSGYTAGTYSTAPMQQVIGAGTVVGNYNHDEGFIRPANTVTLNSTAAGFLNINPVAGTMVFNGNLTLSGGEITYDTSLNPASGNDLVQVTGTTALNGGKIVPNFLAGVPSSGNFTVLTSDGGFTGSVSNITVDFPGRGTDPAPFVSGNSLMFSPADIEPGANLVWTGANGGIWNVETTQAWTNNGSPDVFFNLDSVTFNETATNKAVSVATVVSPTGTVTINNTSAYTFTGAGAIVGSVGLTKTGTGNLTMQVNNSFNGPANVTGTVDIGTFGSGLGTGTLTLNNATLLTTTSIANSSIDVPAGTTSTIQADGAADTGGTSGIPTLTGDGTLTITSTVDNKWFSPGVTSGFTGTLNIQPAAPATRLGNFRIRGGQTTFPNAVVNLTGVTLVNQQGGTVGTTATFEFGELHGDSTSILQAFTGGSLPPNANWQIGALNTNSDFAGTIVDGAGVNATPSISSVTKVGTGTLTLTGANTYTGNTTVNGGVLSINQPYLSDLADVFVAAAAIFDLNFSATDVIDSLYLNNLSVAPGTWGSLASAATNKSALFSGSGILQVTTLGAALGVVGDYNGNNVVDAADYTTWRDNLGGLGSTLLNRDPINGAGVVSQADYDSWKANFGATFPGAGGGALSAVPEPASWVVGAMALAGFICRRPTSFCRVPGQLVGQ